MFLARPLRHIETMPTLLRTFLITVALALGPQHAIAPAGGWRGGEDALVGSTAQLVQPLDELERLRSESIHQH